MQDPFWNFMDSAAEGLRETTDSWIGCAVLLLTLFALWLGTMITMAYAFGDESKGDKSEKSNAAEDEETPEETKNESSFVQIQRSRSCKRRYNRNHQGNCRRSYTLQQCRKRRRIHDFKRRI